MVRSCITQATLADSFILDLEDLERDDDTNVNLNFDESTNRDSENDHKNLESNTEHFSYLLRSEKLINIVKKITPLLNNEISLDTKITFQEQTLINECNSIIIEIDTEILNIHKYAKDIYSKKFPELDSIVTSPIEYLSLIKLIQNETDLTKIDMKDIIPSATAMAITVASTMTTGSQLESHELLKLIIACDDAIELANHRNNVLLYLETRMTILAPNISKLIGSALTARLITMVGGLQELAKTPAQNIMLIGNTRGISSTSLAIKGSETTGVISCCELVQYADPILKSKAIKMVSSKVALASRVDLFGESKDGSIGEKFKKHILDNLAKALEAPDLPDKKPLPIPEEKKTKKRGGRRYRKMKEKYGMSRLRKESNMMALNSEAKEDEDESEEEGVGLNWKSTGKGKSSLQIKKKQNHIRMFQLHLARKRQLILEKQLEKSNTNGMTSSLAFTPFQGIELHNPRLPTHDSAPGYFDKFTKFTKLSK